MIDICNQFQFSGHFYNIEPYGDGHINDTYKVTYTNDDVKHYYILQKINHHVFKDTKGLMTNINMLLSYLNQSQRNKSKQIRLIKTHLGHSCYYTEDNHCYRAYNFIENSKSYSFTQDSNIIYQVGKTFGNFQVALKHFPASSLIETIKDFHHTPRRFQTFLKVYESNIKSRNQTCLEEVEFLFKRHHCLNLITQALDKGDIPLRVTHNDTKINNVLLDCNTNKGLCVIDLDTVMPGSLLYDFGDAIRTCASQAKEDEEDLSQVTFNIEHFKSFTDGYLNEVRNDLTQKELELLAFSPIIMTLECGMRFLTDHLEGDVYFKIHKTNHNLIRAKNQFKLVEEMEKHLEIMKAYIKGGYDV